jgi:hypothetical protein
VPEGLSAEKLSLASEVTAIEQAEGGCMGIYEALLDLVWQLGKVCGRRPHHELYLRLRDWRKQTTPSEALRKAILEALRDLGGSGHQADVLDHVREKIQSALTPADREKVHGGRPRWERNALRERKRIIDDGLLTPDSRRSTWTLAK